MLCPLKKSFYSEENAYSTVKEIDNILGDQEVKPTNLKRILLEKNDFKDFPELEKMENFEFYLIYFKGC